MYPTSSVNEALFKALEREGDMDKKQSPPLQLFIDYLLYTRYYDKLEDTVIGKNRHDPSLRGTY